MVWKTFHPLWKPLAHWHSRGSEKSCSEEAAICLPCPAHLPVNPGFLNTGVVATRPARGPETAQRGVSHGADLTRADAVLPDEAGRAPGPAHTQGSGARLEGDPGVVGPPGLGGTGPQPGHQEVPVADGGHVWSTALQRGASLAVTEESLARRAQAAEAALEVVALVGAGLGQLQALVDIWGEQGQARCPGSSGLCCSAWLRPSLLPSSLSQNPAASPPAHQPATKPSLSASPASSPLLGSTAPRGSYLPQP